MVVFICALLPFVTFAFLLGDQDLDFEQAQTIMKRVSMKRIREAQEQQKAQQSFLHGRRRTSVLDHD